MLIYEDAMTPNARRVNIFLAEKGITDIPREQVAVLEGKHRTPEYRKINPLAQVPSMVMDDGRTLSESVAICRYFEEKHPEPPLMGKDPYDCAEIDMWQRRVEFNLFMTVAMAFRHTHPVMSEHENQVKEWGELNHKRAIKTLHFLNEVLEGREYLAASGFSIADITGLIALDFMAVPKIEIPEECKNVKSWHERLAARPSAKV